MASALMISASRCSARSRARSDLPVAVGPTTATTGDSVDAAVMVLEPTDPPTAARSGRSALLGHPRVHAPLGLLVGDVLHPGHDRPALPELVQDGAEPVTGDERGHLLAHCGTSRPG